MHRVKAKTILSGGRSMNIYRGCLHGCIYCDSRSLCYGFTHDFEDIEVKENAPELLEAALKSKRKRCVIGTGAMSDPYLPIESELQLTRRCLELIDRYAFGAAVLTKSTLVLRDAELLQSIHEKARATVQMTLTTFDEQLCSLVEPGVSLSYERFQALCRFRELGVPTVVWLTPLLPFLNDTEENLRGILSYCAEAGVKGIVTFGFGLTLREGDREYYYAALDRHFPGLKQRYIREYGNAYVLPSPNEARLREIFEEFCGKYGIMHIPEEIFADMEVIPEGHEQLSLFP